jgi:LPXTG-site transpeptidase (sortase) family protein
MKQKENNILDIMNNLGLLKLSKLFLCFGIVFTAVFVYFNWSALNARLFYNENENFTFEKEQKNNTNPDEQNKKTEEPLEKGDRLVMKKINVSVPIISISSRQDKVLQEGLKRGAVIFPETSFPGKKGNCVIVGHSSNYPWRKGNYDNVFVLLDKLRKGDEVEIFWQKKKFKYIIFEEARIVKAGQMEILAPTEKSILTLMTCWPIGTNYKRLIVKGKLVE